MVLDYSKFDNIELSDDSDIEVHPNIDKKSFIKWKQRDIHEKRERAKQQMAHYHTEVEMNQELMSRIDKLMEALKQKVSDTPASIIAKVMQSYPAGSGSGPRNGPTYREMMESLLKQIDAEVKSIREEDMAAAITHKLSMHRDKLLGIIAKRRTEIKQLEEETSKKITSDGLREGFNYSSVKKVEPEAPIKPSILKTHPVKEKTKTKTTVETLNPDAKIKDLEGAQEGYESGSDMDTEGLPEHIEPSKLGREFGSINIGDYDRSLAFISKHPGIVRDETETDGLFIDAYYAEIRGESTKAKQFIHQGLLLQFCRQLGKDGVSMFFHRIKDQTHRAAHLFYQELESTYGRIKLRAQEAKEEEAKHADSADQVEQIQLHAVNPGTKIAIQVPPRDSPDPEAQKARQIFESFSPRLQRAIESGKLDAINKVLGDMKVDEAENVVEQLSAGGMLNIEDEMLDATQPDFQMPERTTIPERIDDGYLPEGEEGESSKQPSMTETKSISAVDDID